MLCQRRKAVKNGVYSASRIFPSAGHFMRRCPSPSRQPMAFTNALSPSPKDRMNSDVEDGGWITMLVSYFCIIRRRTDINGIH